jgi:hypothetical protein
MAVDLFELDNSEEGLLITRRGPGEAVRALKLLLSNEEGN